MVGSGLRRLALAWALQSGQLLGPRPADQRVFWHLDPVDRLDRPRSLCGLGRTCPALIGGELVWLVDGYLSSEAFPGSTRVHWRGGWIGALRAGLGRCGPRRRRADSRSTCGTRPMRVAKQWRVLTDSLIQPSSAIPSEVVRALPYPAELLEAQVRVLSEPHWGLGQVIGRPRRSE